MNELPLHGIRVLDLSWIIAGPTATRFLASMGAEVIKIGSARRPDPSTRGPAFQAYNQSKLYASLNISTPDGLALIKQLIAVSDVVIENFAVGVIDRLGLSYEAASAARPDIIMVSSSGTGHLGPHKDYVAYGSLLQHYTGWNSISGNPQGEPVPGGLWADPWVGMELAMVTAAALNNRALTGQGQYIDFSMAEALTAGIPGAILDYQMNQRLPETMGNRDARYAPHGVYHCVGADRWVAIAVTNDDEVNIMSSLLAKRLGVRQVVTLIGNPAYVDLMQGGDIDIAISPQQATIGSLLTHVRRGDIVNVYSLRRGAAEAIEVVAHGDGRSSKVVGKSVGQIDLPPGTTIGAIVRDDEVLIAHDSTVIESDDHVILFVIDKKHVRDVERLFQVGLTFL